jgi:hypothetical protein
MARTMAELMLPSDDEATMELPLVKMIKQHMDDLIIAVQRLLPIAEYITDMPDDEAINLVTTVGAVRQLEKAINQCQFLNSLHRKA